MLKLLENGSAGVLVLGCPKDNCTFVRGNYRAEKRIAAARALLCARRDWTRVGCDMEFVSSLDSRRLIDAVASFKRYIDDHGNS